MIKLILLFIISLLFVSVSCYPQVILPATTLVRIDPQDEDWQYYSNSWIQIDAQSNLYCLSRVIEKRSGRDRFYDKVCIPRAQEGKLLILEGVFHFSVNEKLASQYK